MRTLLATFLVLPSLAISSQATEITETFTGTVFLASATTGDSLYTPPVGSAVRGSITFDAAVTVEQGGWQYSGGVSAAITDFNGFHVSTGNGRCGATTASSA